MRASSSGRAKIPEPDALEDANAVADEAPAAAPEGAAPREAAFADVGGEGDNDGETSPIHALLASAVSALEEPAEEERWPPGVGVLFAVVVCGAFWWAVIAAFVGAWPKGG